MADRQEAADPGRAPRVLVQRPDLRIVVTDPGPELRAVPAPGGPAPSDPAPSGPAPSDAAPSDPLPPSDLAPREPAPSAPATGSHPSTVAAAPAPPLRPAHPTSAVVPPLDDRPSRRPGVPVLLAALVAVVALVAAGAWWASRDAGGSPAAPTTTGAGAGVSVTPEARQAAAWLRANTAPGSTVLVPPELVYLIDDALGRPSLTYPGAGATGDAAPDFVLRTRELRARYPAAAALAAKGTPVAVFGAGADAVTVLETPRGGAVASKEAAARAAAGRELLENDALTFSPASTAALRGGDVDPRLLVALSGLAVQHALRVDLPVDPAAPGPTALRRTAIVTSVDGTPVRDDAAGRVLVAPLLDLLRPQPALVAPAALDLQPGTAGLRIAYRAPVPAGLLDNGGFPTAAAGGSSPS